MPVRIVEGVVHHYEWGDHEFIPALLGVPGRGRPWAELWLGTHPRGPSTLDDGSPLVDRTGELPYLLKVLSAAQPLSLQAHPSPAQARAGFENGVFADPFPKPELFVALTHFEALCGVRPVDATVDLLHAVGAPAMAEKVASLGADAAIRSLYTGDLDAAPFVDVCRGRHEPEAVWVQRLDRIYPGDPSVAVALLLNHVVLVRGEALHLTAGNLHAYLCGSGIELMRASDNVVRGGLTTKDVDVDLLLEIVDLTPQDPPTMVANDGRYPLPEAGVALVELHPGDSHVAVGHELAIALDGTTLYIAPGTQIIAEHVTFVVTPDGSPPTEDEHD
jgi:mannose-6-phosphate isomerase